MTAAVHAGEPIHLDTDPESGRAFHISQAEAAAEEARQRLRRLERQLKDATAELERISREGNQERTRELEDRVTQIHRKILATRVRVERAEAEVSHLLEGIRWSRAGFHRLG
jgi:flagellar biosynthesis/type III secretory pathway protein FliH